MFGKTYPNCVKKKRKSEEKLTEKKQGYVVADIYAGS